MPRSAAIAAGIALPLLCACGSATVTGTFTTPNGQPIAGAAVTVSGQPCAGTTDAKGNFSLDCEPGTLKLSAAAEGFTAAQTTVKAPERRAYSSGLLFGMPTLPEAGLARVEGMTLSRLPRHALRRTVKAAAAGALDRRFCLDPGAEAPLPVSEPQLIVAERRPEGATSARWRLLKLDGEGCAYRDQRNDRMQWRETWLEKPTVQEQSFGDHHWAEAALAPGDWFVADWNDFFVPIGQGEDRDQFGGTWLRVTEAAK